ncbi:MAG: hypothetical protein QME78_12285 [Thermodesulfobacteriota bacterium]|nr:hypothetical protein [Thermodesulfobacteriota bacterium]
MNRQRTKTGCPVELPRKLQDFFWDYDFKKLSWIKDRDLIISRVLSSGGWDEIIWLRSRMSDCDLSEWIERRKGRGLSSKQLRFWEIILKLSHRKVNAWLEAPERKIWEKRGNL